jgi:hypothetical protein
VTIEGSNSVTGESQVTYERNAKVVKGENILDFELATQ